MRSLILLSAAALALAACTDDDGNRDQNIAVGEPDGLVDCDATPTVDICVLRAERQRERERQLEAKRRALEPPAAQ